MMSVLRRGDQGPEVERLQEALLRLGAKITDPAGHFGVTTEAAVYVFQHAEALEPDGRVGPLTSSRLTQRPIGLSLYGVSGGYTLIDGVPYFTQRDNQHRPHVTCNVTSLGMALAYHGVRPSSLLAQLEDELYEVVNSPEAIAYYREHSPDLYSQGVPPQQVFDNLVWLAERYGVRAHFSTQRTWGEIETEIEGGRPVLLSGTFTDGGHIVLLIGQTTAGDLICHDPYGDWQSHYHDRNGESRVYERERVRGILKDGGGGTTWGLFLSRR